MERFQGFPHGQVEEDTLVLVCTDCSWVICISLKAPDEPRAVVRQGVDGLELRNEAVHERVIERGAGPGDVGLSEVEGCHGLSFAIRSAGFRLRTPARDSD